MSGLKVNLEECQCQKNATDATQATNAPAGSSDSNATTYNQGNGQEELIMMTGPLGEVYTKALAQYFVKAPDNSLEDISIESQAQDVALTTAALREHIRKVAEQGAGVRIVDQSANIVKTPRIIAYAVPANATTQPENIVKVQAWVDKAKRTNREVVMICDSTITNTNWLGTNANVVFDDKIPTPFDIGQNFVRATENYFEPMGVTVVNGARGFVDWVKENCGQGKYVPADPIGDQNTQTEVEDVSMEGLSEIFGKLFNFETPSKWSTHTFNKTAIKGYQDSLKKLYSDNGLSGTINVGVIGDIDDSDDFVFEYRAFIVDTGSYRRYIEKYLNSYGELIKEAKRENVSAASLKSRIESLDKLGTDNLQDYKDGLSVKVFRPGTSKQKHIYLDPSDADDCMSLTTDGLRDIERTYDYVDKARFIKGSWGKDLEKIGINADKSQDDEVRKILKDILVEANGRFFEKSVNESTEAFLDGFANFLKLKPAADKNDDSE